MQLSLCGWIIEVHLSARLQVKAADVLAGDPEIPWYAPRYVVMLHGHRDFLLSPVVMLSRHLQCAGHQQSGFAQGLA